MSSKQVVNLQETEEPEAKAHPVEFYSKIKEVNSNFNSAKSETEEIEKQSKLFSDKTEELIESVNHIHETQGKEDIKEEENAKDNDNDSETDKENEEEKDIEIDKEKEKENDHDHDKEELGFSNNTNPFDNNRKENNEKEESPIREIKQEEHNAPIIEDYQIITKAEYLKLKIAKMKITRSLASGIEKGMTNSTASIKDNFLTNHLQNMSISTTNQQSQWNDNQSRNNAFIQNPARLRLINELKQNEACITNKIRLLNHNQDVLGNESYLNLAFPASKANAANNSIRLSKINNMKKQKEILMNRRTEVSKKIRTLTYEENIEDGHFYQSMKDNLHEFENDFEKKRELIARKMHKIKQESIMRQQKMSNEIGSKLALRINQIEMKEKENEQKKMIYIEQLRQQEREAIVKRKQLNKANANAITKDAIIRTNSHSTTNKSYSYINYPRKYAEKENDYIKENIRQRKDYMKLFNNDELSTFSNEQLLAKERKEEEQSAKSKELKLLWLERSKLKPDYVSPLANKWNEKEEKRLERREEKKVLLENNRQNRLRFSNSVIQPRLILKEIQSQTNEMCTKSKDKMTPRQSNQSLVLRKKKIKPKMKMALIKSMNNINAKDSIIVTKSPINQIDYLLEKRRNDKSPSKEKDWDAEFGKEQDTTSFVESMLSIKHKSKIMDEKIKLKRQYIDVNERIGSDPEFCEEMSTLMINSIKAKLSILNHTVSRKEKLEEL